jgi:hypothetical protein
MHLQTRRGPGLVVFDNATDPDGVRPLLPSTGAPQEVITSTDRGSGELGDLVDGGTFARAESVAYLADRTGAQGLDEDFAVVRPGNTRSAAVAHRNGMEWVGETDNTSG